MFLSTYCNIKVLSDIDMHWYTISHTSIAAGYKMVRIFQDDDFKVEDIWMSWHVILVVSAHFILKVDSDINMHCYARSRWTRVYWKYLIMILNSQMS